MPRSVRAEYNLAKKAYANAQYRLAEARKSLEFAATRYERATHALIEQQNAREKKLYGV